MGCALRQNHSIPEVLSKLAERTRTERTHAAVVVPMFSALIMFASVDRHGRVAIRSEILSMPFVLIFSTSQNVATAFVLKHKKTIDVTDLSWPKTIRYRF